MMRSSYFQVTISIVKWAAAIPVHPGFTINSAVPSHSV